ncbi:multicopper oxidase domain-containing protein [Nocardia sp. NPDC101769]|uniref:multicopper oxidase domain-containing protein n=1 Tax=Nocardia sp. NPDC101769 TaxID=3364333 RepID=UPI0038112CAC
MAAVDPAHPLERGQAPGGVHAVGNRADPAGPHRSDDRADYPGRFLIHCHTLEHEDMAMMANLVTSRD